MEGESNSKIKLQAALHQIDQLNFRTLAIPALQEDNQLLKQRISAYIKDLSDTRKELILTKIQLGESNQLLSASA